MTTPSGGISDASPISNAEGGDAQRKARPWSPFASNLEYDPKVDDPDDILDLLVVLHGAVRDADPQIRGGTVCCSTLSRVHDAALRVIGAARNPRDVDEAADRGFKYLETLFLHAGYAMDRLAEKLMMPDGG